MADFSYEKIKDLEGIVRVPVLTLDERWYKLIPAKYKTDEINYWENHEALCGRWAMIPVQSFIRPD